MGQGAVCPSPLVGAQGVGVLKERAFLRHREGWSGIKGWWPGRAVV